MKCHDPRTPQKSPRISGCLTERDLRLKAHTRETVENLSNVFLMSARTHVRETVESFSDVRACTHSADIPMSL